MVVGDLGSQAIGVKRGSNLNTTRLCTTRLDIHRLGRVATSLRVWMNAVRTATTPQRNCHADAADLIAEHRAIRQL